MRAAHIDGRDRGAADPRIGLAFFRVPGHIQRM
jgi:hypothetical protein